MNKIGIRTKGYWRDDGRFFESFLKMREHGFECADFDGFTNTHTAFFELGEHAFTDRLKAIKEGADRAGITFSQAHAPWDCPPPDATPQQRRKRLEEMIRGCRVIGCPYFVVHAILPFGCTENPLPEEFKRINIGFFTELVKPAEENGVTVCLENLPFKALSLSSPTQVLDFVKTIDSPFFKMCFDTGHAALYDLAVGRFVRQIGKDYLAALHIHDNNGKDDQHLPVFQGSIDWEDFRAALRDIGFEGTISLETAVYGELGNDDFQTQLAESARWLADREP